MGIVTKESLKVLRVKTGLTQEEFAEKAGVSAKMIGLYEADVSYLRRAKYKTLEKLAKALNVEVDNIFLG